MKTITERFAECDDGEYLKFDRITEPLSKRPDIHAFLLLDRLVPGTCDMVAGAEHDAIYLDANPEAVNVAATDEDILSLYRCGVMFDEETDSLFMFA